jgi:hypothetical protein
MRGNSEPINPILQKTRHISDVEDYKQIKVHVRLSPIRDANMEARILLILLVAGFVVESVRSDSEIASAILPDSFPDGLVFRQKAEENRRLAVTRQLGEIASMIEKNLKEAADKGQRIVNTRINREQFPDIDGYDIGTLYAELRKRNYNVSPYDPWNGAIYLAVQPFGCRITLIPTEETES